MDLDLDGDLDVVMEDRKGEFLRIAWQHNDTGPYPEFEIMEEGMTGSSGTPVLWQFPTRKPAAFLVGARDELLRVSVQHPEGVTAFEVLGTTDYSTTNWYYFEFLAKQVLHMFPRYDEVPLGDRLLFMP